MKCMEFYLKVFSAAAKIIAINDCTKLANYTRHVKPFLFIEPKLIFDLNKSINMHICIIDKSLKNNI